MIHLRETPSHSGKHAPPHGIRRFALAAALGSLVVAYGPTQASPITLDMVTVGNPGNAADSNGNGSVNYGYDIGKYEVTIAQYAEFLNAVAATDTYSLYNGNMANNSSIAGITRNGEDGSYGYSVIPGSGNKPITYVSWFDAARFINWMQNGQPTGAQGAGTTETGAYTLDGAMNGNPIARNPGATIWLPTQNEWYKAAYYDASLGGGAGGYWAFSTRSNADPGNIVGGSPNQANYYVGEYPNGTYSVTQLGVTSPGQNYLTDVGAFTNSASYYGTFDQTGNVREWNDLDGSVGTWRGLRGGYWAQLYAYNQSSSYGGEEGPEIEDAFSGFRVAAVPEPATWVMGLAGLACAGWGAARRTARRR